MQITTTIMANSVNENYSGKVHIGCSFHSCSEAKLARGVVYDPVGLPLKETTIVNGGL